MDSLKSSYRKQLTTFIIINIIIVIIFILVIFLTAYINYFLFRFIISCSFFLLTLSKILEYCFTNIFSKFLIILQQNFGLKSPSIRWQDNARLSCLAARTETSLCHIHRQVNSKWLLCSRFTIFMNLLFLSPLQQYKYYFLIS